MRLRPIILLACALMARNAPAQQSNAPNSPANNGAQSGAGDPGAAIAIPADAGFAPPDVTAGSATPTKAFKLSTRLVVVDVVVTDKRGAPVLGLKRDDFRVLESGREQPLKVFEERKSTNMFAAAPSISEDATGRTEATNAGQEHSGPALNVILFDALNTASSDQSFARTQVKKVIGDLPPGSRIAIFVLRGDLHMVQGFTTDTTQLAAAMEKDKSTLSGPWFNDPDAVLLSQGADPAGGIGGGAAGSVAGLGSTLSGNSTPGQMGPTSYLGNVAQRDEEGLTSSLRTAKTFAALASMAKYLSVLPGRKNLLWLAGVFPFDLLPDTSGANPDPFRGSMTYGGKMHDLATQMEAGHIAVYPIDVRGLVAYGGAASGGRPSTASIAAETGAQLSQQSVMENIAHETGGRAIYNDNDIRGEIIESLNQGGNFYTLAYSPTDKNWNGKYRKIEVKTEVKDVHLYYRHGYLADDPDSPTRQMSPEFVPKFAVAMLRGAPERAEVAMTVTAESTGTYIEQKDRKPPKLQSRTALFQSHLNGTTEVYLLTCNVDAKTVSFDRMADGKYVPHLALTFLAYDADGQVLNAGTGLFNLPLSEAQYQAVLKRGLAVTQKMEVPVGRAYLRVGVHDLKTDKVGATELPLVVVRSQKQTASAQR